MILADVNVLVSAFRSDSIEHHRCRRWLEEVVNGESRYGVSPQVLSAVVRVTTQPRVFREPSPLEEVLNFCDTLLRQPNAVRVQPQSAHWNIFKRISTEAEARGNLIPDAWFAALAIESGCEWITLDCDYARFPGLKWRVP